MFNPFGAFTGAVGGVSEGYNSYQDMRLKQMQREAVANELEGNKAFGRTLQEWARMQAGGGADVPPGAMPMPPMPGQASVLMQPPQQGGPQMFGPPGQFPPGPSPADRARGVVGQGEFNPVDAAAPPSPGGGGMFGGMPGWAPGERPLGWPTAQAGPAPGMGGVQPGATPVPTQSFTPGGPPGGAPTQPSGSLNWQSIAQKVSAANPEAKPEWIASAVSKFLPLMTAQSQSDWKSIQQQLQMERLDSLNRHREMTDLYRGRRQDYLENPDRGNPATVAFRHFMEKNPDATPEQLQEFARTSKASSGPSKNPNAIAYENFLKENPGATADEQSQFLRKLRTSTTGDRKIGEAIAGRESVVSQIDDTIKQIEDAKKGGSPITGLMGRGRRYYEGIAGSLGVETGTAAKDFETSVNLLKNQVTRLLAGSSRIAKDEREQLNTVIRGLDPFESPTATISALRRVRQVILEKGGMDEGVTTPKGGATAKPMPADIKRDYDASLKAGVPKAQLDEYLRQKGY